MNPDTGKVYRNASEIARAESRGERLVPVSARAANIVAEGRRARRAGLVSARQQRKTRKAAKRAQNANDKNR